MSLLEARQVGRRFDARWVLKDVDLTVAPGERVALLGPSGCGKTTLLNLLGGLDRPDQGEVRFRGEILTMSTGGPRARSARSPSPHTPTPCPGEARTGCLAGASPRRLAQLRRESLGTVFQLFHLVPTLTARENIELPLQLLAWPRSRIDPRVAELLDAVGLTERAEAWPRELSGGEMQRVAVARALAAGPALLLADEPTGNLDSASGEAVLALLAGLTERTGAALVLVTHSPAAAAICHRVVHLKDGRVVGAGR